MIYLLHLQSGYSAGRDKNLLNGLNNTCKIGCLGLITACYASSGT